MNFVRMEDFQSEGKPLDWDAYNEARRQNGESCTRCGGFMLPTGAPTLCADCNVLDNDAGEIEHPKLLRCPACAVPFSFDATDGDGVIWGGEEQSATCPSCDHEFAFTVRVEYHFKSPALTSPPRDPASGRDRVQSDLDRRIGEGS